jgi:anti-sigma factor RsiW
VTCEEVRELLSSYIDGELDPKTRDALENHIKSCRECEAELAGLRQTVSILRSLDEVEVPETFRASLMEKVREAVPARAPGLASRFKNMFSTGPRRALVLAAAALVLVVAANSVLGTLQFGEPLRLTKSQSPSVTDTGARSAMPSVAPEIATRTPAAVPAPAAPDQAKGEATMKAPSGAGVAAPKAGGGQTTYDITQDLERQVIKRASLQVETPQGQFDDASRQVMFIVEAAGGFIQDSSVFTDAEQKRTASFAIRIPADSFTKTLGQIEALGKVQGRSMGTQDVTDQFIDLEAYISSREVQQARLRELLGKAKTVDEILRIENELNRLRYEIDSMKGRIRYLKNAVAMSSINLSLREFRVKPDPAKPDLWKDMWTAFVRSVRNIVIFLGQSLPYLAVAWFIWFLWVTARKK